MTEAAGENCPQTGEITDEVRTCQALFDWSGVTCNVTLIAKDLVLYVAQTSNNEGQVKLLPHWLMK